jgi:hypothetical protein
VHRWLTAVFQVNFPSPSSRRQAMVGKELRTGIAVVCLKMSHPIQTTERMG